MTMRRPAHRDLSRAISRSEVHPRSDAEDYAPGLHCSHPAASSACIPEATREHHGPTTAHVFKPRVAHHGARALVMLLPAALPLAQLDQRARRPCQDARPYPISIRSPPARIPAPRLSRPTPRRPPAISQRDQLLTQKALALDATSIGCSRWSKTSGGSAQPRAGRPPVHGPVPGAARRTFSEIITVRAGQRQGVEAGAWSSRANSIVARLLLREAPFATAPARSSRITDKAAGSSTASSCSTRRRPGPRANSSNAGGKRRPVGSPRHAHCRGMNSPPTRPACSARSRSPAGRQSLAPTRSGSSSAGIVSMESAGQLKRRLIVVKA